jgi:undecaprenyl-diphosphatase
MLPAIMSGVDTAISSSLYNAVTGQPLLAAGAALIAEYGVFVLPLALIAVWFGATRKQAASRRAIVVGCLVALTAGGVGLVLEHMLTRPRPFVELGIQPLIPHAPDSSFPSEHTLVGVALVGALAVRVPRIGGWLLACALVVGFARVAAGLHHPTDVLGSAALALALDLVAMSAFDRLPTVNSISRTG